jgi:type IV pilus assembly protein PilB
MVLVTGPTGSGKTVSLYTCLNILNKPDINISTAEDPVEINLPALIRLTSMKGGSDLLVCLESLLASGSGCHHGG